MGYPRHVLSRSLVKARRTAGNLTLNSTSWADVDTGIDLTLDGVKVGDELIYGISGWLDSEATPVIAYFDVATVVSASPVNSFAVRGAVEASPGVTGVQAWRAPSGVEAGLSGYAPPYTVVAGDLDGASVTLRLRYATATADNRNLHADANAPLDVWAWNLGPKQGS